MHKTAFQEFTVRKTEGISSELDRSCKGHHWPAITL